jgi:Fungal chitosanase of glycosyl hydrolase group 75
MQYRVSLEIEDGATASIERSTPESYSAELVVKVKVPKPHKDLEELARLNENLPTILPELATLLQRATISPHYDQLYRLKVANLQQSLNRLDLLLSRHNFFDCETVLELQHPRTKRRALLVQADMDVDGDGSDSDRVPEVDASSVTFQPFTSYKWGKKTQTPNPFIAPRETKIKQLDQELATPGIAAARSRELKETRARLKGEIADLKKYSYLVAATDPYVVLPGSMFSKTRSSLIPAIGDFCVVVFGKVLYPAVIGDAGPPDKTGEGSLRLCKELNPLAEQNNRPVSDLKVTYLIFPGSAERPFDAPNLDKWRRQCAQLLDELGGHEGELFAWEDLTKPKLKPATPAPTTPPPSTPAAIHSPMSVPAEGEPKQNPADPASPTLKTNTSTPRPTTRSP